MAVYRVVVDVATRRPPRVHARAYVVLEADNWLEAELVATQMVCLTRRAVVMAVGSRHVYHEEEVNGYE
jgi:hypothetical protein